MRVRIQFIRVEILRRYVCVGIMRECLVNRAAKGKKRIEITRDEANKDADT